MLNKQEKKLLYKLQYKKIGKEKQKLRMRKYRLIKKQRDAKLDK